MLFEQALGVLKRQAVLIVAVSLLAIAAASASLYLQAPLYSSTITLRYNGVVAAAAPTGQLGTSQIDLDPASLTSPSVLSRAAAALNLPAGALDDAVSYVPGTPGEPTARQIEITATAMTAIGATKRATAVGTAYTQYLQAQLDDALSTAVAISEDAVNTAEANQRLKGVVAQAALQSALAQLNSANSTVQKINTAGPPLTVLRDATIGEARGVGVPVALTVALLAGLIAGVGAAFIRDQFDSRLKDGDLERITGTSLLGTLALDNDVSRTTGALPTLEPGSTPLVDDLRALRAAVHALLPQKGGVVVVTSAEPGDGKSFVAANLATASANIGRKVVLVEGDLRAPGLHRYFAGEADDRGFIDLMVQGDGQEDYAVGDELGTLLQSTAHPDVRLLPPGSAHSSPSDLLAGPLLAPAMNALQSLGELVIVNAPPAARLSDAGFLAKHADGAVMVVSIGRTERRDVIAAIEMLRANGVELLGFVANRSHRKVVRGHQPYYDVRSEPTESDHLTIEKVTPSAASAASSTGA